MIQKMLCILGIKHNWSTWHVRRVTVGYSSAIVPINYPTGTTIQTRICTSCGLKTMRKDIH